MLHSKSIPSASPERKLSINPADFHAAYALDALPLYRYAHSSEDSNQSVREIRVQLVCCSQTVQAVYPLLSTILWCGQMIGFSLHIRIVSDDAEALRQMLIEDMPLLTLYSNIRTHSDVMYIDFEFVSDKRISAALSSRNKQSIISAGRSLGSESQAGWTAVFLGKHTARFVTEYFLESPIMAEKALILDCCESEFSQNTLKVLSESCTLLCLHDDSTHKKSRDTFETWLIDKAYRHHLLYAGNMHGQNNVDIFCSDAASHHSSIAAALHMKYKLRSIGIDPDTSNTPTIIKKYTAAVFGSDSSQQKNFRELTALEHRRWIVYQAVHGWKLASMEDCRTYCFEENNFLNQPIYKFKIDVGSGKDRIRLHPALVPGGGDLQLHNFAHSDWDRFLSEEAIDQTQYDPLAKVSLKLHLLAKEKMDAAQPARTRHLDQLRHLAAESPQASNAYRAFCEWFKTEGVTAHRLFDENHQFLALREDYIASGISSYQTDSIISLLRNDLKIVNEFYSYTNYEKYDSIFVEHLAEIYARPLHLTVIKIAANGKLDNVASSLLLEPERVVMYGLDTNDAEKAQSLLNRYIPFHSFVSIESKPRDSYLQLVNHLRSVIKNELRLLGRSGRCIIDITDAHEDLISAVWHARSGLSGSNIPGVIRCSSGKQHIENLIGFPLAPACRKHVELSVEDILSLHNIKPALDNTSHIAQRQLLSMRGSFKKVWSFYLKEYEHYATLVDLLHGKSPLGQFNITPYGNNIAGETSRLPGINKDVIRFSGIMNVLRKLKNSGIISDYCSEFPISVTCMPRVYNALSPLFCRLNAGHNVVGALHCVIKETTFCIAQGPKRSYFTWDNQNKSNQSYSINNLTNTEDEHFSAFWRKLKTANLITNHSFAFSRNSNRKYVKFSCSASIYSSIKSLIDTVKSDYSLLADCIIDTENRYISIPSNEKIEPGINVPSEFQKEIPENYTVQVFGSIKSEHHYAMKKTTAARAGLSYLLNKISSPNGGYNVSAVMRENLSKPDYTDIVLSGTHEAIQPIIHVLEEIDRLQPENLTLERNLIYSLNNPVYRLSVIDYASREALECAQRYGIICNLTISEDKKAEFSFVNSALVSAFNKLGMPLEYYIWYEASSRFAQVANGYSYLWGSNTQNEIDILIANGMQLSLISCKARKKIKAEDFKSHIYEIRLLSNHFSRDTNAILLYLCEDTPNSTLQNSAKTVNASVLVLDRNADNADKLKIDGSTGKLLEQIICSPSPVVIIPRP